jgi:anti-sigma B factor antagonist
MGPTALNCEPAQLQIRAGQEGNCYIVRLIGELDGAGAGAVEMALVQAEATTATKILLDIDELSFIDSSGLGALMRAEHRADGNGARLRVTRGTGHVADMLRLTALDLTLPFV